MGFRRQILKWGAISVVVVSIPEWQHDEPSEPNQKAVTSISLSSQVGIPQNQFVRDWRECSSVENYADKYQALVADFDKLFPLSPSKTPGECNPPSFYINWAARLVDLHSLSRKPLNLAESNAVYNLLIGMAYTRLFENILLRDLPWRPYWMYSAIFANDKVGELLRQKFAYSAHIPVQARLVSPAAAPLMDTPKLDSSVFTSMVAINDLGTGNQAIYRSIFPQLLMAADCGPQAVATQLEAFKQTLPPISLSGLKIAWEEFEDARQSRDRSSSLRASVQLLRFEQQDIIQDIAYSPWYGQVSHALRIFNAYANTDSGSGAKSFDDYTRERGLTPNLADANTRIEWMRYIVETDASYVDRMIAQRRMASILRHQKLKAICYLQYFIQSGN